MGSVSRKVERRRLGTTGLELSGVGFGASPFGDVFGETEAAERVAAVRYAIERGINFFDVSPYYGLTLAESRLGEALAGHRDEVILATKCGRYGGDEFDFSAERVTAGLEDSLRRLGTSYVDLLQAHDVEFGDADQIVEETVPAMRRLQEQGKARFIGLTGYSLKNLMAIAARVEVDSMLTYCRYNLLISDADDELMRFADERGIGVINASPMHMGILTERGAPPWHPAPAEVLAAGRRVMDVCRQHGMDGSQVALKYCYDHPQFVSTLVGMATPAQVKANLDALELSLKPEFLAAIREAAGPAYNRTWASGREENHG